MLKFSPNKEILYYLYYIQERMNIFWNRLEGNVPYSDDQIFQENKFTNVYRALDRSSQYLLRNVIYNGKNYTKEEMFWRIIIYKHFNLPLTWDLLLEEFEDINSSVSLDSISDYLVKQIDNGATIYSNAYMMTSAFLSGETGKYCFLKNNKWRKHQYYFYIFKKELIEENKISLILNSITFKEMFDNMSNITSMGDFTTYQYCQDLNYTEFFNFDDNEFCAAGPGTQRGIKRVFDITGKVDFGDVVKWTAENYDKLVEDYSNIYDIDLRARQLPNWPLKVPDFSNAFCETDKYMRQLGINSAGVKQGRMKQKFKPNNQKIDFFFPPKWNVGELK